MMLFSAYAQPTGREQTGEFNYTHSIVCHVGCEGVTNIELDSLDDKENSNARSRVQLHTQSSTHCRLTTCTIPLRPEMYSNTLSAACAYQKERVGWFHQVCKSRHRSETMKTYPTCEDA